MKIRPWIAIVMLAYASAIQAQEAPPPFYESIFYGSLNGVPSTCQIEPGLAHGDSTADRFYGLILGNEGSTYILMADLDSLQVLKGMAWDKFTASEYPFTGQVAEGKIDFVFTSVLLEHPIQATFTRQDTSAYSERTRSAEHAGDQRLVGMWRRTESHADSNVGFGGFSMVTEWTMAIHEDGRMELAVRSAGGTGSVSGQSPGQVQKGFWKAQGKHFYTSDTGNAPWMLIGEYLIDARQLMFKQQGSNQLWSRLQ